VYELSKDSEFSTIPKTDPLAYRKEEIGIEVCINLVSIGSSERSEILNFSILATISFVFRAQMYNSSRARKPTIMPDPKFQKKKLFLPI